MDKFPTGYIAEGFELLTLLFICSLHALIIINRKPPVVSFNVKCTKYFVAYINMRFQYHQLAKDQNEFKTLGHPQVSLLYSAGKLVTAFWNTT